MCRFVGSYLKQDKRVKRQLFLRDGGGSGRGKQEVYVSRKLDITYGAKFIYGTKLESLYSVVLICKHS